MIKVLDLFSGIGGFSLGLERTGGFETAAFCEIEEYPQRVLKKHWPDVPIFDDVRKLTKEDLPDDIRLVCGGYPCQPFSTAGKRKGAGDDRHLWPEVARLVSEIRPDWCLFENVAGHVSMGLDEVLSDLEGLGYTAEAFIIPAVALDAHHRRDRVWIVAHTTGGIEPGSQHGSPVQGGATAAPQGAGLTSHQGSKPGEPISRNPVSQPTTKPVMGGGTNGLPRELDVYRGLINEQGDDTEADAEALRELRWRLLRAMWEHRGAAKASPELYCERLRDSLPEMPHEYSHGGWYLGAWIEESEGLRCLWEAFYSKSFKEAQDLQQKLLERIRAIERTKEVGPAKDRVDRLKALGNSVVPQVVQALGQIILAADSCPSHHKRS